MRSVLVGVLLIAGAACAKTASPAPAAGATDGKGGGRGGGGGAAPVSVAQVVERSMPVTLHAVGTVTAPSTVDIRSQVTGLLMKVGFSEGQDVKAGDTLFTLDQRPFQIALNQANSVLSKDKAQLANAEESLRRAEELYAKGLLPNDNDAPSESPQSRHARGYVGSYATADIRANSLAEYLPKMPSGLHFASRYIPFLFNYSARMPAAFTTLPHLSRSARKNTANSSGVIFKRSKPCAAIRSLTAEVFIAWSTSKLSRSTIA